jgi:hypothetical protein
MDSTTTTTTTIPTTAKPNHLITAGAPQKPTHLQH